MDARAIQKKTRKKFTYLLVTRTYSTLRQGTFDKNCFILQNKHVYVGLQDIQWAGQKRLCKLVKPGEENRPCGKGSGPTD